MKPARLRVPLSNISRSPRPKSCARLRKEAGTFFHRENVQRIVEREIACLLPFLLHVEESVHRGLCRGRKFFEGNAAQFCNLLGGVADECGLAFLPAMRDGREVGKVGLDHEGSSGTLAALACASWACLRNAVRSTSGSGRLFLGGVSGHWRWHGLQLDGSVSDAVDDHVALNLDSTGGTV